MTNSSMPDGAEAVMETDAELDEYRGKHLMEMLDSFHDRGILRVNTGVDLYIRDDVGDPGVDLYTGPVFWNSPTCGSATPTTMAPPTRTPSSARITGSMPAFATGGQREDVRRHLQRQTVGGGSVHLSK